MGKLIGILNVISYATITTGLFLSLGRPFENQLFRFPYQVNKYWIIFPYEATVLIFTVIVSATADFKYAASLGEIYVQLELLFTRFSNISNTIEEKIKIAKTRTPRPSNAEIQILKNQFENEEIKKTPSTGVNDFHLR